MQCIVTLFHCIMGSLAYRFVPAVVMPFHRHADTPRWMVIMQHALQHYRFTGITIGMLRPLLYYGEVSQQQRCLKCMCLFAGVGLATCCTPGRGGGVETETGRCDSWQDHQSQRCSHTLPRADGKLRACIGLKLQMAAVCSATRRSARTR